MFFFWLSDGFPLTSNPIANTQLLQYESASRIVDTRRKYEEFYESYLKIDGASSFPAEKAQENTLKSCAPRVVPSLSFNDKNQSISSPQHPHRKQSTLIMLSYKRKSVEGNEKTEICKCFCMREKQKNYRLLYNKNSDE